MTLTQHDIDREIAAARAAYGKRRADGGPVEHHPRRDHAPHRSSVLRHPKQPPVAIDVREDPELVELHSPAFGERHMDTATMLVAVRTLQTVLVGLDRAARALAAVAAAHRDTVMPGRTLTQHAVPTTFGLKAAGWRALVLDARDRTAAVRDSLPAQLGGAAGTLAAFTAYGAADAQCCRPRTRANSGCGPPVAVAHAAHAGRRPGGVSRVHGGRAGQTRRGRPDVEPYRDAHVDRAQARQTPFAARFEDFVSRCVWGRSGRTRRSGRRERSLITLTALTAHGHHDELALHVRAARRNGLTPEEIGAVLLQTAMYCGVPAANAAFATAQRVLAEEEGGTGPRIPRFSGPDAALAPRRAPAGPSPRGRRRRRSGRG